MNNDKSLFLDLEHWSETALQIDTEASQALRPIIDKYLAEGYNIREICHILIHNAAGLEHEFILGSQYRVAQEKRENDERAKGNINS